MPSSRPGRFLPSFLVAGLVALGLLVPVTTASGSQRPVAGVAPPRSKVTTQLLATYLYGLGRSADQPGNKVITPATVRTLAPTWTIDDHAAISLQPAVSGKVVYWGDWGGDEVAASAVTGHLLWRTDLGTTTGNDTCTPRTVGVASSPTVAKVNGVTELITGTGDGGIAALDAATGKIRWRVHVAPTVGGFEWSSPAVYEGAVYMGVASFGDCPDVDGHVLKLNAANGTIEAEYSPSLPQGCTGDTFWSSPAIDTTTDTLFIGTGNAITASGKYCYSPLADALVALSTKTLKLVDSWHVPKPQQYQDADIGATPTLFEAPVQGHLRRLVGVSDKNGIFYAFGRSNIAAGPLWTTTLATPGTCPWCDDAAISPAAFDGTNLYLGAGRTFIGGRQCRGSIRSVAAGTGKVRWVKCLDDPVLGAVTAVPGVVFVPYGPDVTAFGAAAGARLFNFLDPTTGGGLFHAADFWGPVTEYGGSIYVGSMDGLLRKFTVKTPA